MMDFGWKKKAERLRGVLLSAGHQPAKELPPGFMKVLDFFRRVAKNGGDGQELEKEIEQINIDHLNEPKPLWEPVEIYGWKIEATFYLQNGQLWWLLHVIRRNEKEPSAKDIAFLDKILDYLGADPKRDLIIGPRSSPAGEPALVFGWWTWFNHFPLNEIQVKGWKSTAKIRIVPLGAAETDGYQSLDKLNKIAVESGQPSISANNKKHSR